MIRSLMGAFAIALLVSGAAQAKETKVTMSSLPAPVRETAMQQTKGDTILDIVREVEAGKTMYELETMRHGGTRDILIGADGTLLVVEEQVALKDLPAAVRTTVEKSAAQGKISRVEAVRQRGVLSYYEAQIKKGKKVSEIKVGPDGALKH